MYMTKRRYYVPDNEVARDYRQKGDLAAYQLILQCDWDGDEFRVR